VYNSTFIAGKKVLYELITQLHEIKQ